jgi:hypothetical protein
MVNTVEGSLLDPDELVAAGTDLLILRLGAPFDLGPLRELIDWRDTAAATSAARLLP